MMEMRWRAGGREAWGSLLNFLDNQKDDGSLHGRLYPNHLEGTDFYHANWGDALLAVHAMHPDPSALARCYEGLSRYAKWLDRSRDPEGSGMFTVVNHFETGQEYMSRYMAVDPEADVRGWQPRLRLKGIDVTVYAHQLFRALGKIAGDLGRTGDEAEWRALATRSGDAITGHMWSPEARLCTDVDGRTFTRTNVKAAVGFYPLLTDLVDDARLDAMMDHLEDPRTFGTPFPLPSSSVDDPRFSAEGIWRGKRPQLPLERARLADDDESRHRGAAALPPPGQRAGGCARRGHARPLRADDVHRWRSGPTQLLRALQSLHRPRLPLPRHRRLSALVGAGSAGAGNRRAAHRRDGSRGVAAAA